MAAPRGDFPDVSAADSRRCSSSSEAPEGGGVAAAAGLLFRRGGAPSTASKAAARNVGGRPCQPISSQMRFGNNRARYYITGVAHCGMSETVPGAAAPLCGAIARLTTGASPALSAAGPSALQSRAIMAVCYQAPAAALLRAINGLSGARRGIFCPSYQSIPTPEKTIYMGNRHRHGGIKIICCCNLTLHDRANWRKSCANSYMPSR